MKKNSAILFIYIVLNLVFAVGRLPGAVNGDFSAIEIVNSFKAAEKGVTDGDILSSTGKGLARSKIVNDSHLFGVATTKPLAAYKSGDPSEVLISRNGVSIVNVTILTGEIKKGDLITSSEIAGKGEKAISSGYVLGSALEDFNPSASSGQAAGPNSVSYRGKNYQVGKIMVGIRIEYADINSPKTFKRLFDFLGTSFFSSASDPSKFGMIVRYIAAGLVAIVAILFAFLTFSRSIPKALEAIGRNPLARSSIYASLAVSVFVMLIVIILGIAGAFVLLKI